MADVRISTHYAKSQSNEFSIIRFYDGLENLIGTKRVILRVETDRLYFFPVEEKIKGSLKLSNLINVWKQCKEVKAFDGEYPIDFDAVIGVYYIDIAKRSEISRQYGNHNVPHVNYKPHVNEPYVDTINATSVTITTTPKVRKYSMVVYDGLLELLRVQISDLNKPAVMATLNTIKSLLADE